MKNKVIFLLIFFFVISFVSAASSVKVFLTNTNYAGDELFKGNLLINESEADISDDVVADIIDCGSYNEKRIKLYDLLVLSDLYSGQENKYTTGESKSSILVDLTESTDKLFGININDEIDSFNFNISGSAGDVFIDVGADGENDWKYSGSFSSWNSTVINSVEYPGSYELINLVEYNPSNSVCEDFEVEFENLTSSLNLQVNAVAKSSGAGTLTAKVNGKTCTFSGIGTSWTNVNCNVTLDVSNTDSPETFEVCLQSNNNNLKIPQKTGTDFHFMSLKKDIRSNTLTQNLVKIDDSRLKEAVDDYYDNCDDGWCVIPFRINALKAGNVNISSLSLTFGSSSSTNFYEISSEGVRLNLTNELIPLNFFTNLKTPDVQKKQTCTLKIQYQSDRNETKFNMSIGPTAVIKVASKYVGSNLAVEFDGSGSKAANNRSVTSYSWDFDDGSNITGSKVSHTFKEYGDYNVTLTVKDSNGIEDSQTIEMHVLELEEYLDNEFDRINRSISNSSSYLNAQTGDNKNFVEFMGYKTKVSQIRTRLNSLEDNFTKVRESDIINKDSEYSKIAGEISVMGKDVVTKLQKTGSLNVQNVILTSPDEIVSYSGKEVSLGYQNSLYNFNSQNVNVNMNMIRYYVSSLAGNDYFVYVKKTVNVYSGTSNVAVENLKDYDINEVYTSMSKDTTNKVIYMNLAGSSNNFEYVVKTDVLEEIKTIVFSDVKVESEFYCFNQAGNCQSYCGDGSCDSITDIVDESDSESDNYCEADCKREDSLGKYIILLGIFFLILIYLFLYRGPGSFKHVSNKTTYWMINKKLFLSEQDRLSLNQFVIVAFRRGYNEVQIRQMLLKKGWNHKQIDVVMENYLKKKY